MLYSYLTGDFYDGGHCFLDLEAKKIFNILMVRSPYMRTTRCQEAILQFKEGAPFPVCHVGKQEPDRYGTDDKASIAEAGLVNFKGLDALLPHRNEMKNLYYVWVNEKFKKLRGGGTKCGLWLYSSKPVERGALAEAALADTKNVSEREIYGRINSSLMMRYTIIFGGLNGRTAARWIMSKFCSHGIENVGWMITYLHIAEFTGKDERFVKYIDCEIKGDS
ncbi:hypothetical protein Tco_0513604 [Tanacetum coccineum]